MRKNSILQYVSVRYQFAEFGTHTFEQKWHSGQIQFDAGWLRENSSVINTGTVVSEHGVR